MFGAKSFFASSSMARMFALAIPLLMVPPAPAAAAPPLPISERYALADKYLGNGLVALIEDGALKPRFTSDGRGVTVWPGRVGSRRIRLLDIESRQWREIGGEAELLAKLGAALGRPVDAATARLEALDYDTAAGTLRFRYADSNWALQAGGQLLREAREAGEPGEPGVGPSVSPDGRFEVFARNYNLVARDRKSGREVALTTEGTREQPFGRGIPTLPEILKAGTEEPDMPVSVRWSPDSRQIATWRLDTRGVKPLSMTQQNPPGGALYPRSFHYIYPLAGAVTLPQAMRLAINVEDALKRGRARPVVLNIPPESLLYPADPDFDWQGDMIRAQWTERGYGQLVVYQANPATGGAKMVAREALKPLVTVTSSFLRPAPELGGELNVSERTGWAQLYLVTPDAPDGGRALTSGPWEVISIDHVDAPGKAVLLTGVGREKDRSPYSRSFYRVPVEGGEPRLLTPEPLDHNVTLSADGNWFLDEMSSPTQPTETVLRSARDGEIVARLGKADPAALQATGFTPPEPFEGVAADGKTPLYGMIWRPANFDPKRSYPVIEQVYTGPTTTNTPVDWNGSVASRVGVNSLAQIGAILVSIDGRGTSRRGRQFRLPAYQNLGEVGLDDHIAMLRQMAVKYPQMDLGRVGVFGGSAGGYDAARFILRRPNFYKVAVAWAGNHDLRLDKSWWPEVSMGNAPPEIWEKNSNMSVAGNLTGKLMLVHGDVDDNVPVTESFRLANALITAGRDVDLVILPNTSHAVYQPFFWKKMRDYFTRHLLDEAPPPLAAPTPANQGSK